MLMFLPTCGYSQNEEFKIIIKNKATPIKFQYNSGACWCFATTSFIESELIRKGFNAYDLSEAYFIRKAFEEKSLHYYLRQGKTQFSCGGLAYDVIQIVGNYGFLPEQDYPYDTTFNCFKLEDSLKNVLDSSILNKFSYTLCSSKIDSVLDIYFTDTKHLGKKALNHTAEFKFNPDDYISLTSFTHHPFYEHFVLEIPDNAFNGSYLNIPINELCIYADSILFKGYTFVWDGDVSKPYYSKDNNGIALLTDEKKSFLGKTDSVQIVRQMEFESFETTEGHLMHCVGLAEKNNTKFYLLKNSSGNGGVMPSYILMSENYFKLKTISIFVNKYSLPKFIYLKKKITLNN